MKNLYQKLAEISPEPGSMCLATLLSKTGSAPQVPGSSALITATGLLEGTLGGGILEEASLEAAKDALKTGRSAYFNVDLNDDITATQGAICGGKAGILIDASPMNDLSEFRKMSASLRNRVSGILITHFESLPDEGVKISRRWQAANDTTSLAEPFKQLDQRKKTACLQEHEAAFIAISEQAGPSSLPSGFFIEPVFPLPRLIIAGAGHIGKALTHLASLLDFDIVVIDDRPGMGSHQNLPEAGEVIIGDFGHTIEHLPIDGDTYIVIVTHGHAADADALRACINKPAAYIGMIGSRRKTGLMRKKFLDESWATERQWDRIHAPIGLDIGSKTVPEIAVSIAAELIWERHRNKNTAGKRQIWGLVLAAGESKRMGTPKMLLSYGESTIIETVIDRIGQSSLQHIMVVVGAGKDAVLNKMKGRELSTCVNPEYHEGMYSSVMCGFKAIPKEAGAIIVFLGDQPMVRPELIDRIIDAWQESGKGIIIPVHQKKRGHPVLIDARYRDEVLHLDPENGLRSLMSRHAEDIFELDTNFPSILRDIDTASDYQRELAQDKE